MIQQKSDKCSVTFKNSGNEYFQQKKFQEALIAYNMALNHAISKENVAIAYANRSAVYLEMKKYQKCLQNIQWALENEYPAEKVQKLFERKTKCEELMQKGKSKDEKREDEMREFFKLSYPANPKIPFIIDGLEVRMTERMGRGIFTTRDLQPGDIISVEKPFMTSMAAGGGFMYCCNCSKSRGSNLIPCLKTASLMFCSIECRDEVYAKIKEENFNCLISGDLNRSVYNNLLGSFDFAFGGREHLVEFAKRINVTKWKKTLFDYDFSNPDDPEYKKNALKSILSFVAQDAYKVVKRDELSDIDKFLRETNVNPALRNLLLHAVVVWRSSVLVGMRLEGLNKLDNPAFDYSMAKTFGSKVFRFCLFSPLMNYSCFPNVMRINTDESVFLCVTRPIKAGQELFRGVASLEFFGETVQQRRAYYKLFTYLNCVCYYCENGINAPLLPSCRMPFPTKDYYDMAGLTLYEKIMLNFGFIKQYEERFPLGSIESYGLSLINQTLMTELGNEL